jgi:hypothetical protein
MAGSARTVWLVLLSAGLSILGVQGWTDPAASASPASPITVIGATDGVVSIGSNGPSLDAVLSLRAGTDQPKDVAVQVTVFRSQDGHTYPASVQEEHPRFVGRLATVRVLADRLPFGGPFTAELTISHDSVTDPPVTLSVTRTYVATPLTVDSVQTVSVATTQWWGSTQAWRQVTISETGGRKLELAPITVVKPSSKHGELTSSAAVAITEVKSSQTDGCTVQKPSWALTIGAGRVCQFDIKLTVPAGAGSYDGLLRFSAPGFQPVDNEMSVQVRRTWWLAVVPILAGVLLALIVRWLLPRRREALEVEIAIARERERLITAVSRLRGNPDAEEQTVVDGLHTVLDTIQDRLDEGSATDATTRLAIAHQQVDALPAWVSLHRALIDAGADIRQQMTDWEQVTYDITDSDLRQEEANNLSTRLENLQKELIKKARKQILLQAEEFEAKFLDSTYLPKLARRLRQTSPRPRPRQTRTRAMGTWLPST